MLTEETHAAGVSDAKVVEHEEAAHQKRNWVRLTYDCNNRCIFCLDSDTHDGEIRDRDDIKKQILDGRRKGAERLILSGGEPTIHPRYIDFIKLGRMAGYAKVQTVTNGRLFAYPEFLSRCLDAGLSEITFSVHGPNAKIHDALVGVKGAYDEEITGLKNALADGRPIVNIDVVINRGNVKHLATMLRMYIEMGVREFDLLQVVPFGRAFTEGKDTLFYDLEEMRPHLLEAFAYSKLPGMHIWLNRFPPQHLEGYEHLIQDPYKLNDEVRGRKEEFARLLDEGTALDCRDPNRCRYCYLEKLCDTLDEVRDTAATARFEVLRVDTAWEAQQGPVFGGDPASARRARAEANGDGRVRLPVVSGPVGPTATSMRRPDELARAGHASVLRVLAPTVDRALEEVAQHDWAKGVELELGDYKGLEGAVAGEGPLGNGRLRAAVARSKAQAEALLAIPGGAFEVRVALTNETAPWVRELDRSESPLLARIALFQPTYERLTEAATHDVDLREFFSTLRTEVPVEGVPACVLGRPARSRPRTLDASMMTPDGRLEIFRYTKRYILEGYTTHSLRCSPCVHRASCEGMHVNYVRAHGYGLLQPVLADAE